MDYLIHIVIMALIYAVFALSLNLQLGFTGLYNFGHVAFFGVGAYVSALLSVGGVPVPAAMACALLAAGACGALLALPALRLTGDYFGVATLVFAEMMRLFFLNEKWLTRGPMGIPDIPRPAWIGDGVDSLPAFFLFTLFVTVLTWLLLEKLTDSPFGRALKVVREDEYVAKALGKNTTLLKVKAVTVGSILAGLAGVLWAHYITYISPGDFTLNETVLVLLCVVLGGRGTNLGPVIGAFVVTIFGESIRFIPLPPELTGLVAPFQGMIYGGLLILIMLKRPEGIVSEARRQNAESR